MGFPFTTNLLLHTTKLILQELCPPHTLLVLSSTTHLQQYTVLYAEQDRHRAQVLPVLLRKTAMQVCMTQTAVRVWNRGLGTPMLPFSSGHQGHVVHPSTISLHRAQAFLFCQSRHLGQILQTSPRKFTHAQAQAMIPCTTDCQKHFAIIFLQPTNKAEPHMQWPMELTAFNTTNLSKENNQAHTQRPQKQDCRYQGVP